MRHLACFAIIKFMLKPINSWAKVVILALTFALLPFCAWILALIVPSSPIRIVLLVLVLASLLIGSIKLLKHPSQETDGLKAGRIIVGIFGITMFAFLTLAFIMFLIVVLNTPSGG